MPKDHGQGVSYLFEREDCTDRPVISIPILPAFPVTKYTSQLTGFHLCEFSNSIGPHDVEPDRVEQAPVSHVPAACGNEVMLGGLPGKEGVDPCEGRADFLRFTGEDCCTEL